MRNLLKVTSKLHLSICQHFQSHTYTVPSNHQHRKLNMDFQSLQATRDHEVQSGGWNTGFLELNPRKVIVAGERPLRCKVTPQLTQLNSWLPMTRDCPTLLPTLAVLLHIRFGDCNAREGVQPLLTGGQQKEKAVPWGRISRSQGSP